MKNKNLFRTHRWSFDVKQIDLIIAKYKTLIKEGYSKREAVKVLKAMFKPKSVYCAIQLLSKINATNKK